MLLHILSDIHLEFPENPAQILSSLYDSLQVEPDVTILAGDIISYTNPHFYEVMRIFSEHSRYVIYVAGNHEYYHGSFATGVICRSLVQEKFPNIFALHRQEVDIEGQKFIGATLWFRLGYPRYLERKLNDFRAIKGFEYNHAEENELDDEFITNRVTSDHIVVTHHLPCSLSVNERFKGDPFNCFYVCDMDNLINEKQPKLWIHGHGHDPVDYTAGNTRVFANPLDYPIYWGNDILDKFKRGLVEV